MKGPLSVIVMNYSLINGLFGVENSLEYFTFDLFYSTMVAFFYSLFEALKFRCH